MKLLLFMLTCLAAAAATPTRRASALPSSPADLARCPTSCGKVNISYPFGIGPGCSRPGFELTCNRTTKRPRLYLGNATTTSSRTRIVKQFPNSYVEASVVFNIATARSPGASTAYTRSWEAPGRILHFAPGGSQYYSLVFVGCGVEADLYNPDTGDVLGHCSSACADAPLMERVAAGEFCNGLGCCAIKLTGGVDAFRFTVVQRKEEAADNHAAGVVNANSTIKAFLSSNYRFSMADLISDTVNSSTIGAARAYVPAIITDEPNCQRAQLDQVRYACGSNRCVDVQNRGYYCTCPDALDIGNPYVLGGCNQEYDPNQGKPNCSRLCGSTSIPFPFGLEHGCSANRKFQLNCTSNKALIGKAPAQYQVTNISLDDGLLFVDKPSDLGDANAHVFIVDYSGRDWSQQTVDDLHDFDFAEQYGVWKWTAANTTCEKAKSEIQYACVSSNSECSSVSHGPVYIGYRCKCSSGYQGNPYVKEGCKDINECLLPNYCNGTCYNWEGSYSCTSCRHGKYFDPVTRQCSYTKHGLILGVVIGLGCGIGVLAVTILAMVLVRRWKRSVRKKIRRAYFRKNNGLLLEQLISSDENAANNTRIFSLEELEKATTDFDTTRIVGHGGHGTVYKGILSDQRIVAIKKSKIVEQSQIDQFVNEVAILSQIIHRNVVKLFGCCLESEVPLLVYEFIPNGTLYDLLHGDLNTKCLLRWDDRIRVALEAACALAYLHSAASIPIIHRDVKSSNILLNDNFTTKVSDFGASRSISIDETHVVTIVQGTFGYLDPEYYHTGQLTEKSDVYSFGVILVELLTRKKPIFLNCFGEKQNLCHYFLQSLQHGTARDIVDTQIVEETNDMEIGEMVSLAEMCLRLRGDERPTMKELEIRLQLLRAKILKENRELQRDNELDHLLLPTSSCDSPTEFATAAVSSEEDYVSRCNRMEQELVSCTDLSRGIQYCTPFMMS